MSIVTKERPSKGSDFNLSVDHSGMVLTVRGGTFTLGGEEIELEADQPFTATSDADDPTAVIGYIVEEVATEAILLLVDEVVMDGVDEAYAFTRTGPYRALHRLFSMTVPAAATTLDAVDVVVEHLVAPTAPASTPFADVELEVPEDEEPERPTRGAP